jgi:hypothetical protein
LSQSPEGGGMAGRLLLADKEGNANGGNRLLTVLMYLSDVEEGGETVCAVFIKKQCKKRQKTLYVCASSVALALDRHHWGLSAPKHPPPRAMIVHQKTDAGQEEALPLHPSPSPSPGLSRNTS